MAACVERTPEGQEWIKGMVREQSMRDLVLDVLRHVAPDSDLEQLDPERTFREQLGIDSIDFLNFVSGLEERVGRRIAEIDFPHLSTLNGCLTYLQSSPAVQNDATAS